MPDGALCCSWLCCNERAPILNPIPPTVAVNRINCVSESDRRFPCPVLHDARPLLTMSLPCAALSSGLSTSAVGAKRELLIVVSERAEPRQNDHVGEESVAVFALAVSRVLCDVCLCVCSSVPLNLPATSHLLPLLTKTCHGVRRCVHFASWRCLSPLLQ
jgi:hypothetical protein